MKVLALVILLITCTTSDGLRCLIHGHEQLLTESLIGLNSEGLSEKIKGLNTKEYDNSTCRIEFSVASDKEFLFIKFTAHLQRSKLRDEVVRIDSLITGTNADDISASHFIEYSCSEDLCEVAFVEKYSELLDWLLHARYSELSNNLTSSIFGDGEEKGECFNLNNDVEPCDSGKCVANIEIVNDEYYPIQQFCDGDDETGIAGIRMTLYLELSFYNIETDLLVKCNYDKCNDEYRFSEIALRFFELYNIVKISEMYRNETTASWTKSVTSLTSVTKPPATTTSITKPPATTTSVTKPPATTTSVTKPPGTTTSISTPFISNNMTTTEANNGFHVQSTNTIIYLTLIIFISYWFLLA